MKTIVIIGKNFGDEGKGLATDFFSSNGGKTLVVRHNGGAQAGHTVEIAKPEEKRFIFHELSSGSFRGASSLWTDSFYPDLVKLGEEINNFSSISSLLPSIYAMEDTCITTPDDILINMAIESSRGNSRHGSCAMGINECDIRKKAGYGICLNKLKDMSADDLINELFRIRNSYTKRRLKEVENIINENAKEYLELLSNDNVIINAAYTIIDNLKYINVISEERLKALLLGIDTLIFETGQGLLLDCDNKEYAPNVTASHTGLKNSYEFLKRLNYKIDEVIYVSRTYVTRHGAGKLNNECQKEMLGQLEEDKTNEPNLWQGKIRYAKHENIENFVLEVNKDLSNYDLKDTKISLFLTHLNETNNMVIMSNENILIDSFVELPKINKTFDTFYFSSSHYSNDVKRLSDRKWR